MDEPTDRQPPALIDNFLPIEKGGIINDVKSRDDTDLHSDWLNWFTLDISYI